VADAEVDGELSEGCVLGVGGGFGFVEVGAGAGCTTVTDLVGAGLCEGDAVGVGLGTPVGVFAAGLG
jgi:hypothetical protein